MKSKFLLNLGLFATALALVLGSSSCSHYFYGPNMHHNALLEKKNEVVALGAVGIADETSFGSLNLAYAPTNKLGVYGQFYRAASGSSFYSGGNGAYGDIAIGTFDTLKGRFRYELMLGLGNGKVFNSFGPNQLMENKFNKYFGQLNLGYRSSHLDVCFSLRTALVNQYSITVNDTGNINTYYKTDYNNIQNKPTHFYFEPGIYISGGLHNWKLQLGMGGASMIASKPETYYPYQNLFLNVGLKVNFTAVK